VGDRPDTGPSPPHDRSGCGVAFLVAFSVLWSAFWLFAMVMAGFGAVVNDSEFSFFGFYFPFVLAIALPWVAWIVWFIRRGGSRGSRRQEAPGEFFCHVCGYSTNRPELHRHGRSEDETTAEDG